MVTYPDDATFNTASFSTVGEVTYTTTGPSKTTFQLGSAASSEAEILAIDDGAVQNPQLYVLTSNLLAVTFTTAPNSTNVTLKTLSVPERFKKLRVETSYFTVNFDNTTIKSINANNYLINNSITAWAIPEGSTVTAKSQMLVSLNGLVQHREGQFTWPSSSLANNGIDISPALDTPDALEIRVFDSNRNITDRCSSMSDKRPDKGYGEERQFNVLPFETEAGYEKRRLRTRKVRRQYSLTYTNVSGLEKNAIRDFYDARFGTFEAFSFDLDHLNQVGTINVRFHNELNIKNVFDAGTDDIDKFYTINLTLREIE
jgi:hypothetical protein